MNQNLIFIPLLAQVVLTILLFIRLGSEKTKARKTGNIDFKKTALHHNAWPDHVLKVSNNIENQFETPILFYVISIMFYLLDAVGFVVMGLSIVYVISRYIHAYIHINSNYVPSRFKSFLVGVYSLLLLTIVAIFQVITSII